MLNFVQVDEKTLIQGIKYKIVDNHPYYNRKYISVFNKYDIDQFNVKYLLWGKTIFIVEIVDPYSEISYVYKDMTMPIKGLYDRHIYKLVSSKEKIQCAMELRAVNIVLQNIIGDNTFIYNNVNI